MNARVVQSNPGWLERLLKRYKDESVLAVGYPASETGGIQYPDGTPVTLVAAVNVFGSQSRNIPSRDFMTAGAAAALAGDAGKIAAELVPLLNEGKITIEEILEQMGPFAEGEFKAAFTGNEWAPNAQSTIDAKESSQPLIDTGLLRNSLTYVVRKP